MISRMKRKKKMRGIITKVICILMMTFLMWIEYVAYMIGMVR